jgi:antitoxin ParD1/3/4
MMRKEKPAMNLTLNPQISRLIEEELNSGRFSSAEELVAAGVARMLSESHISADDLADIQADVAIGIEQADRGEFADFTAKAIIAEGRARLAMKY